MLVARYGTSVGGRAPALSSSVKRTAHAACLKHGHAAAKKALEEQVGGMFSGGSMARRNAARFAHASHIQDPLTAQGVVWVLSCCSVVARARCCYLGLQRSSPCTAP